MDVYLSAHFKRSFKKLTPQIKAVANVAIAKFQKNLYDPALAVHKLQGDLLGFSAFSVNYQYRIIYISEGKN